MSAARDNDAGSDMVSVVRWLILLLTTIHSVTLNSRNRFCSNACVDLL